MVKKSPSQYKRAGDLVPSLTDIDYVKVRDVMDTDLIFDKFTEVGAKFGKVLILEARQASDDLPVVILVGGMVLIDKLKQLRDKKLLPCIGKFVLVGNYFDVV
ncbi:hypothetical protein MUP79_09955 [Candidatus Bathyarchaeota archaeon]|nr:hypothetical protein [Candidatus Bathyarchaeota archaeon]